MNKVQRIVIFGRPGSGKSTFALRVREILKLPVYHLDKIFFIEKWVERDKEEFLRLQQAWIDQENWIIDGNGLSSLERRYARADLVIYFCFPRWICLYRVFKRFWSKDVRILDRAPQCVERVSWGLLRYLWSFEKRVRPLLERLGKAYPEVPVYHVSTCQELTHVQEVLEERNKLVL